MTSGDMTAWYAAAVSTAVMFWDIYKWKNEGAKLLVKAHAEMLLVGNGETHKNRYINVRVTNIGTQPSTITNLCGWAYKEKLFGLKKVDKKYFIIPSDINGPVHNKLLNPGEFWSTTFPQEKFKEDFREDIVFIGICHSAQPNKIIYRKIRFEN